MFSLKNHARKNIRTIALGAAAASTACFSLTVHATQDNTYWDPGLTHTGTGSGGTGTFDNTTYNFYNSRWASDAPGGNGGPGLGDQSIWTGWRPAYGADPAWGDPPHSHAGYWYGDLVHFAGTAGNVTVANPTVIDNVAIDTAGYYFTGANITLAATKTTGGTYGYYSSTANVLSFTAASGTATITNSISLGTVNDYLSSGVVEGMTVTNSAATLVLAGGITATAHYGNLAFKGAGTFDMQGAYNPAGGGGFFVDGGSRLILHGTANTAGNGFGGTYTSTIAGGGSGSGFGVYVFGTATTRSTLAGDATLSSNNALKIGVAGNLAPGDNTASNNLGAIGTLTFNNASLTLTPTAQLILDIAPDGSAYDSIALTGSNTRTLTINSGAVVDINSGTGTLTPGTYHIITATSGDTITNSGLAVALAPSGYTYSLSTLGGNAGIDLIVGVLSGSTWTGATSGSGNWSDSANWLGSVPDTAGATATFGTGNQLTVNVDAPQTVGNLSFTGANNYSIGGATASVITLNNSGSGSVISVLGGTQAITSALVLNNDVEISNDPSGGTINISGGITGTGNVVLKNKGSLANALTLSGASINNTGSITNNGTGAGSVLISAAIGSNVTNITQASASSNLTVTGNNTSFAGTVSLNSGTLTFGTNSLGTTGVITFGGGTLQWAPGNTQDVSSRFDTSTPGNVSLDTNGNIVTFATTLTGTTTHSLTLSSTAAGGTLIVTGAQTYTGGTTINSGTLQLAPGASIDNTASAPVINAGGTLDINGNTTTYGVDASSIMITNNGTVTNTGSQVTLRLRNGASGTGSYTGNMDIELSPDGGSNMLLGTVNNNGTVTSDQTSTGFVHYGQLAITAVGSNVTAVTDNGRQGITIGTLTVNSGGTTLTPNQYVDPNYGTFPNITVTNTVVGTGDLIVTGNDNVVLTGGINMAGNLINNSIGSGSLHVPSVGSNVTGLIQNSATEYLSIDGIINVNSGGTTITRAAGAAYVYLSYGSTGTGNLILNSNDPGNVEGLVLTGSGSWNNSGQIINSGTGGAYTVLSGYNGGTIGSNVTAVVQNSATSAFDISANIQVNSAGTTLANNGGAQLTSGGYITGTGDLILQNNTNTDNVIYVGNANNTGNVINSGTGGGYVAINAANFGSNVTGVLQNSATSALILTGTGTYTAPTTVETGTLNVSGSIATSNVTVHSGGTVTGNGTVGGLSLLGGGHAAPSGTGALNASSLTLATGANLDYNFATAGGGTHAAPDASSRLAVSGGGGTLTLSSGVLLNLLAGNAVNIGVGSYELVGYGDTNPITGWADTTGAITGGVVSTTSSGTILLGTGWSSVGANLDYSIVNDAANSGIFIDFTAGVGGGVPAGTGTWHNGTSDGKWTTNTGSGNNWLTGIPNGVGQIATFDDTAVGGPGTVDLDGNKTVGGLNLNTALVGYTLGLPSTTNTLIFQNSPGNATINVTGGATHTINALVSLASNTDVSVASGAALKLAGAVTGTGNMTLTGGGTLILSATGNSYGTTTLNGGTLGGGGTITGSVLAGSGSNTIFPSATLSTTSTTTLTVGGLTTNGTTTLQFNLVTPGNTLNSTVSNSDRIVVTGSGGLVLNGGTVNLTNHSTGAASLGFYKVMSINGGIGGTGLSSLTLPATANNVDYTFDTTHDPGFVDIHRGFLGDVDDSGFVDINDLATLAAHWQQAGGWAQGNFLGDAVVDINDLSVLAAHWQTGITSFGEAADSLSGTSESFQQAVSSIVFGGASSVPEPASLALLGMGAVGLLSRRRRPARRVR